MRIKLFPAPNFNPASLDNAISRIQSKKWTYGSSGSACLFNILQSHGGKGKIALPSYICKSVLGPIKVSGLIPVFFDIDEIDLNPSVQSLSEIIKNDMPQFVLFPSLYGLPANLVEAQRLCSENGVILIDDAAQSFGATLDGRRIGTFGDAGFFAFSPGKATAAHCGGFFWTNWDHSKPNDRDYFNHRLQWILFKYSRLHEVSVENDFINAVLRFIYVKLKSFASWNSRISQFESSILGGVLNDLLIGAFNFRLYWHNYAKNMSRNWRHLRLISEARGVPHPHKIVLLANTAEIAEELCFKLTKLGVNFGLGYPLLEFNSTPFAKSASGRVVELPIVDNSYSMETMLSFINEFSLK